MAEADLLALLDERGYTAAQVLENTCVKRTSRPVRAALLCPFLGRVRQSVRLSARLNTSFQHPAHPAVLENAAWWIPSLVKEHVMAQLATIGAPAPVLAVVNGVPTTTSTDVARYFGKQHQDVLRAIDNLRAQLPPEPLRNFAEGSYTLPATGDQQHKLYRLTRDGFTLLAMGFTGKRALQFKLAYIDAFNRMEQALHTADPERVKLAQSLAAEVAAVASRTVFEAVLSGSGEWWRFSRYLFSLHWEPGQAKPTKSWAQAIQDDDMVTSMRELPARILEPGGMLVSDAELANLAAACNQKLARRFQTKTTDSAQLTGAGSYRKEVAP